MVKLGQDDLDVVVAGHIVVFAEKYEPKHTFLKSYPIIKEFDGVCCDFEFPEGGGHFTTIPLSKKATLALIIDTRRKSVTITIMRGWVEYQIVDDWGNDYYLYIRTSESEIILKSILSYKEKYGIIALLK
tara:strand:+ start:576 stop:965 length:390 start_codon:yes stop_codon:yes gene_type:complete